MKDKLESTESELQSITKTAEEEKEKPMSSISLKNGALTPEQASLMLTTLPVDITFVDENDIVLFYADTKDRIFRRTPAVIGRKVQNCHPAASVHKVQKIVDDFRASKRSMAEFWIQSNGKFIYICYYAVRDEKGNYRGTLEMTQDLTHLREIQGERRLLED